MKFAGLLVCVVVSCRTLSAISPPGQVVTWGEMTRSYVEPGAPVIQVAAGVEHSLALTRAGGVVAWGRNADGQSAIPPGLSNVIAIAAGAYHSLALRGDGTVVAWGSGRLYDEHT